MKAPVRKVRIIGKAPFIFSGGAPLQTDGVFQMRNGTAKIKRISEAMRPSLFVKLSKPVKRPARSANDGQLSCLALIRQKRLARR